ncbi:MAG: hypothetical protein HYX24_00020 [Candidatus Aenigmarchaeota archaeon]|nr:hypothetical protein [Candidatus Aenigmarchaeota archaeon]
MEHRVLMLIFVLAAGILLLFMGKNKPEITVEDVLKVRHEGERVEVFGIAKPYKLRCTQLACMERPCCNSCGGGLSIADNRSQIQIIGTIEGKEAACKGDECGQECWPLAMGKKYAVSGILERRGGELALRMESFREAGG